MQRRDFVKAVGAVAGMGALGSGAGAVAAQPGHGGDVVDSDERLVTTWGAAPVSPDNLEAARVGFENQTLRQVVHTSVGGSGARIRLTNAYGDRAITFDDVFVGVRETGARIEPDTVTRVTFAGEESVYAPAGSSVHSDPVEFDVPADADLVVNIHVSSATGPATWHATALKPTYVADANVAATPSGSPFEQYGLSWFFLEGVDVVRDDETSTVVAFGDSITDGFQSTPDADNTYPDYLARRFLDSDGVDRSVVNAGISGNRVLTDSLSDFWFGEKAVNRVLRDGLAQPGVSDVILLEGINDIGQFPPEVTAEQIIAGLQQTAIRLKNFGINVYGGTLTPTRGTSFSDRYDSPEGEAKREMVNEFVRTTDVFDGVIDFDEAVRDPDQPDRIDPDYDSGDGLHPNDAGYRAMAEAVDLSLFED